jgi:RNA polymerase sigma-70 factor, ECF subfamily
MPRGSEEQAKDPSLDLTALLNRMRGGDREAGDRAVAVVYEELHRIASREMRRERQGHTLQTTALINEAYLRLVGAESLEIQGRGHFFALASQQMRRVLVDHARSAGALRRGGGAFRLDLDQIDVGVGGQDVDVLLLDQSLEQLGRVDARAAQVVELRYFGGYTDKEAAQALGVSLATVRRDWEFARSWLFERLSTEHKPTEHKPGERK